MEEIHGNLLVGGMTLKNLYGVIENGLASGAQNIWHGRISLNRTDQGCVQIGRRCRLELDDGRAGQVVVSRINNSDEHLKLLIEFEGASPLMHEEHD